MFYARAHNDHYHQALRLNPEASHIWGYLRVTFTAMERFDLVRAFCVCVCVCLGCGGDG